MISPDIEPRAFEPVRPLAAWQPGGLSAIARQGAVLAALALLFWVTGQWIGMSVGALAEGIPNIGRLLARMMPPEPSVAPGMLKPTLETLAIAMWGTTLAALLALPLALLAARNLTPHPLAYAIARGILNAQRGVSEMVFALLFVAAVGLGAFPGVLALAVHSAGVLGKFYAEAMENVDPGPIEALTATGAGPLQVIAFAVWPQILPEVVTYTLYRWESDVRAAFVLGIVGAGGLGFELQMAMRLFKYEEAVTILAIVVAVVTLIDRIASRIRAQVI